MGLGLGFQLTHSLRAGLLGRVFCAICDKPPLKRMVAGHSAIRLC